ncbi:hypothetical protein JCM4914_63150 [Streptomyces platensis subsp. malvinus]
MVTAFVRLGPSRGEKALVLPCPDVPEELFTGRPYTESCVCDRRRFDRVVLTAVERAHPRALLERLGSLRREREPDGAPRFIGEADAARQDASPGRCRPRWHTPHRRGG